MVGKTFLTYAYVSMLGYGYGVSRYLQFYDQYLEKYQVLPDSYLGNF